MSAWVNQPALRETKILINGVFREHIYQTHLPSGLKLSLAIPQPLWWHHIASPQWQPTDFPHKDQGHPATQHARTSRSFPFYMGIWESTSSGSAPNNYTCGHLQSLSPFAKVTVHTFLLPEFQTGSRVENLSVFKVVNLGEAFGLPSFLVCLKSHDFRDSEMKRKLQY